MVKNLPADVGDTGSVPGLGRFHIAVGQLSPCTQLPAGSRACAPQQEKPPR